VTTPVITFISYLIIINNNNIIIIIINTSDRKWCHYIYTVSQKKLAILLFLYNSCFLFALETGMTVARVLRCVPSETTISHLSGPVRLSVRYTMPDIHCTSATVYIMYIRHRRRQYLLTFLKASRKTKFS